jgi:hypothetical protein
LAWQASELELQNESNSILGLKPKKMMTPHFSSFGLVMHHALNVITFNCHKVCPKLNNHNLKHIGCCILKTLYLRLIGIIGLVKALNYSKKLPPYPQ